MAAAQIEFFSKMHSKAKYFGDLPPITTAGNRKPDKRQVSLRWLTSTFLVGMTSVFLMGGALFVALEGRQELTIPSQAAQEAKLANSNNSEFFKGDRVAPTTLVKKSEPISDVMMVSTLTKDGNQDVIKMRPFTNVNAPLAIATKKKLKYPPFDPLLVFAESRDTVIKSRSSDIIYGEQVESEVKLKTFAFDQKDAAVLSGPRQRVTDIEDLVRRNLANLEEGSTLVSSLAYLDEERFAQTESEFTTTPGITITAENVSILERAPEDNQASVNFIDRRIPIRTDVSIATILETEGLDIAEAGLVEKVLSSDLGSTKLTANDTIHTTYEIENANGEEINRSIAKLSVFRGASHMVSIARSDDGRFVYAKAPEIEEEKRPRKIAKPLLSGKKLPSVYDGIYRAALSEGLPKELVSILIKVFAFDVDFRTKITKQDQVSVFLSLEDGQKKPTANSEILYTSLRLGGVERKYYRFRDTKTGIVDYYDENGKSSKKFLLRQPVPNGRFNSPFGWRRHPVLRYKRMHWGVDWAAPRGAKILAAGNGVIESAGWAGGNGRRIKINHANGYQTSYSHLRAFAKGIKKGVRVRQGQLIGYVGTSGLSTGPHLHYEVSVNGKRVNPMKIRLPQGRVLKKDELAQFRAERDRINALLKKRAEQMKLALVN